MSSWPQARVPIPESIAQNGAQAQQLVGGFTVNGHYDDDKGKQRFQKEAAKLKELLQRQETEFKQFMGEMLHYIDETYKEQDWLRAKIDELQKEYNLVMQGTEGETGSSMKASQQAAATTKSQLHFSDPWLFKQHDGQVHGVAINESSDGQSLLAATASWDGTLRLFNIDEQGVWQRGCLRASDETSTMGGLYSVAFARTKPEIIGCASADHNLYLWNWEQNEFLHALKGHDGEVNCIDFHFQQQVACSASDDTTVRIWDFMEGIVLRKLDQHEREVYGACFLNNKNCEFLIATCSFDQKARIFDMRDKRVTATLEHREDVIGIHHTSASHLLATGSDDGIISLWDDRTWRLKEKIDTNNYSVGNKGRGAQLGEGQVKRVAFSPCGKYIAAGAWDGIVWVFCIDSADERPEAVLQGHTDCVFDVAWGQLHDRQVLVSASHDKTAQIWSVTPSKGL